MQDFSTPDNPFIEAWTFQVIFSEDSRDMHTRKHKPRGDIQNTVYRASAQKLGLKRKPAPYEKSPIQLHLEEIIENNLSGPDFRYFITEYHEKPGSWEMAFAIVGILYGGVCGYGSFRTGLDYIKSDIEKGFSENGIYVRIRRRFKERSVLQKDRIEPTLNERYFTDRDSSYEHDLHTIDHDDDDDDDDDI